MRTLLNRVFVPCLALAAASVEGASELSDKMAPEPTVNVVWVGVFLLVFLVICVWGVVAIYRAQQKSKVVEGRGEG